MTIAHRAKLTAAIVIGFFISSPLFSAEPLEQRVDFTDFRRCHIGPNLTALLEIAGSQIQASRLSRRDAQERADFMFGQTLHSYIYPGAGSLWHGLTLVSIQLETGIESGPHNVSLVFAQPPEIARPFLNGLGFDLPLIGRRRVIDDEVVESGILFGPHLEGSILTCYSD